MNWKLNYIIFYNSDLAVLRGFLAVAFKWIYLVIEVYSCGFTDEMAAPEQVKPELLHLRRKDTSTQWGMRIEGGKDKQLPLFIATVSTRRGC